MALEGLFKSTNVEVKPDPLDGVATDMRKVSPHIRYLLLEHGQRKRQEFKQGYQCIDISMIRGFGFWDVVRSVKRQENRSCSLYAGTMAVYELFQKAGVIPEDIDLKIQKPDFVEAQEALLKEKSGKAKSK